MSRRAHGSQVRPRVASTKSGELPLPSQNHVFATVIESGRTSFSSAQRQARGRVAGETREAERLLHRQLLASAAEP